MQTGAPVPLPAPGWTFAHLADVVTVVGFAVTIIGFLITIVNVVRSRSAAERAEQAARAARSNLLRVDSVAAISGVISGLEDVKRLHRDGAWKGMPERYGVQRTLLISIRNANQSLTVNQKTAL